MRKIAVVATLVLGSFVGVSQAQADHGYGRGHHGHGHHGHRHHGRGYYGQHYRPYPSYRAFYAAPAPYYAPPVSVYRPVPVYPYYPQSSIGFSTPRFSFFYGQ